MNYRRLAIAAAVGLVLIAAVLFASPAHAYGWNTLIVTNPSAGTVIVEEVATNDENPWFCVNAGATILTDIRVQRRNVANNATIKEFKLVAPANGSVGQYCVGNGDSEPLLNGERIRVVVQSSILGSAWASINSNIY